MWSTGPLMRNAGGNRMAAQQCLSENSSPCTMHLLEKKQSLVTLWSSHMTISSLYCLLSLCTFGQLFFPVPFPTARHILHRATLCRIPCSSKRFVTAPAALWEETKLDAELSRFCSMLHEKTEENKSRTQFPFQKGEQICLTSD